MSVRPGVVVAGKTEYYATATATARLPLQQRMTSSDHNNDLVTSQEKLEWVTPKISLMDAEDTERKAFYDSRPEVNTLFGPS